MKKQWHRKIKRWRRAIKWFFKEQRKNVVWRNNLIIASIAMVAIFGIFYFVHIKTRAMVLIGDQLIKVEVADSPISRVQGLSGRNYLCKDCGMLFVYDGYISPSFWMKDMNFDIDIIWIKDNMVAGYEKAVSAQNGTKVIYRPSGFVSDVLEVNAGFVAKNNLKIGDEVKISNF